ncbi:hypothetical protein BDZ90DRAFT_39269 [Jaminaea rosea]|uniref:Uncharacterized protein n=1 Tax=Jaminaea rosea TaxID=1569628 RepID=A0A316UMD6_9BASI|nr:hypothetical protein BDZ90DRAFT_39269 [Jaminaea rosea]PWN26456.1 hypothetical protein BDZ90DRAFT_39269 [Jaminaea rosea]
MEPLMRTFRVRGVRTACMRDGPTSVRGASCAQVGVKPGRTAPPFRRPSVKGCFCVLDSIGAPWRISSGRLARIQAGRQAGWSGSGSPRSRRRGKSRVELAETKRRTGGGGRQRRRSTTTSRPARTERAGATGQPTRQHPSCSSLLTILHPT